MTPPSSSTAVHGRRRGSPRDEETERFLARDRPAADRAEPSHRAAVDPQGDEPDGARERAGEQERSRPAPARPAFRTELHGLRGLAVLLVAVYHVWFGRVSGGVDVFLFLSAFFLTGTFTRRAETGRPLAIPRYWLRTFKRLMPPAAIVIVASRAIALRTRRRYGQAVTGA